MLWSVLMSCLVVFSTRTLDGGLSEVKATIGNNNLIWEVNYVAKTFMAKNDPAETPALRNGASGFCAISRRRDVSIPK